MKKYQKGWNIFDLLIPILAVWSAFYVFKYVYNKTRDIEWAIAAAFFAFIIYFIPSIYYMFIEDKLVKRKKIKYTLNSAGLLGEYVLDLPRPSYGLFMQLIDMPVFVEIRIEESTEQRKRHAIFLFENRSVLEDDLRKFLDENPAYRDKEIECIGLYSEKIDQCNVYWSPEGCTRLIGLHFEL